MRVVFSVISFLPVLLLACGDSPEFVVDRIDIRQTGWDTLTVQFAFEERASIGSTKSVVPDDVRTTVFSASYDTLYRGSDNVISIPDEELGDQEAILVEVCGVLKERSACEQRTVMASPKKIEPTTQLEFPLSDAYDRGSFRLDYRLFRQIFGSDEWESIRRRVRPETFILAYADASPEDAVKIPVRRARNRFNLSRYDKYRDFRYQIKSQLMDADSASVSFDLYVRLASEPERIASEHVVLRAKSPEERRAELNNLVELAGSQILDRLKSFLGLRSAYVFVNEWSYQPLDKIYTAEIELHWQGGFRREWFDMIGLLTVRANGTAAQYEWIQGSTSAARRWVSRMDSTTVVLENLRPNAELRPPEDERRW
ncbi:MAG: hypothetical protein BMS9Abin05_0115 [Rhodothermia bacterium]|nr:MAG: hypothetical protein BMS9Abin05_0115 [Rhodothermia bacterium]